MAIGSSNLGTVVTVRVFLIARTCFSCFWEFNEPTVFVDFLLLHMLFVTFETSLNGKLANVDVFYW